uniref:DUF4283 domain-containing protein n=1 Tax=Setaria viridis TaxID=4556 RepID=A0A4U6VHQ0_SETVI|nr:hypothetical protein SEVIR_3G369800v2 [Setaria viridis]
MSRLGDPVTRPKQVDCLVQSTGDIDADVRDWDSTAADVERAIREDFKLCHSEVTVSRHFLKAFLIKFKHSSHCSEALQRGKATGASVKVLFTKWRSLRDAEGAALLFRVMLYLDGVPMHAWRADIAEHIIGNTCALEAIDTNLNHLEETKIINLWAWMANPSSIPKCMWLMFTSHARDARLESVMVSKAPPDQWQRGIKHCIILHLEEIHDYTLSSVNLNDRTSSTPIGDDTTQGGGMRSKDTLATAPGPTSTWPEQRGEGGGTRQDREDHGRHRRSQNNDYHNTRWNVWRQRKDDDDDWEHHGRGDHAHRGHDTRKHLGNDSYHERERSPRSRTWGGSSRNGRCQHHDVSNCDNTTPPPPLSFNPLRDRKSIELQFLFSNRASTMAKAAKNFLFRFQEGEDREGLHLNTISLDHGSKVAALVDKMQPTNNIDGEAGVEVGLFHAGSEHDSDFNLQLTAGQRTSERSSPSSNNLASTFSITTALQRSSPRSTNVINTFFTMPAQVLQEPPVEEHRDEQNQQLKEGRNKTRRPRRVFDMSTVRRSARLATSRPMPAMQRAQHNLCRKLGLLTDEMQPIEAALQEFLSMFQGPVPQDIIAALTAIFNLDDPVAKQLDEAMATVAGEAIEDFQEEASRQPEAVQAMPAQAATIQQAN